MAAASFSVGRRGRDHPGAEVAGHVDGGQPDAAAGAEHEHPLALAHLRALGEGEQHRAVALHERGGLAVGQRAGDRDDAAGGQLDVGGEPAEPRHGQHPVADGHAVDAVADGHDVAGHLAARRERAAAA